MASHDATAGAPSRTFVVDAGAIIKGLKLESLVHPDGPGARKPVEGTPTAGAPGPVAGDSDTTNVVPPVAVKLVTVPDVVAEVRDKQARHLLDALPVELETRMPSEDAVEAVVAFAKKTGDLRSLSRPDILIVALSYMLDVTAHGNNKHLRKEPSSGVKVRVGKGGMGGGQSLFFGQPPRNSSFAVNTDKASASVGTGSSSSSHTTATAVPEPEPAASTEDTGSASAPAPPAEDNVTCQSTPGNEAEPTPAPQGSGAGDAATSDNADTSAGPTRAPSDASTRPAPQMPAPAEDGGEKDDDGDGFWITPSNIRSVEAEVARHTHQQPGGKGDKALQKDTVACITTDFAMQNVLLQMGLNVLSVEGMVIRSAKQWMLKCEACTRTTDNMSKIFCPACGNRSLYKISVSVSRKGVVHYQDRRGGGTGRGNGRTPTTKGTRYSIPLPRGGREDKLRQPILSEDQIAGLTIAAPGYTKKGLNIDDPDELTHFDKEGPQGVTGGRSKHAGPRPARAHLGMDLGGGAGGAGQLMFHADKGGTVAMEGRNRNPNAPKKRLGKSRKKNRQ